MGLRFLPLLTAFMLMQHVSAQTTVLSLKKGSCAGSRPVAYGDTVWIPEGQSVATAYPR